MVRMNYHPQQSVSATSGAHAPDPNQDFISARAQVKRILQLAEIVCPDEFQAYTRLLQPYWVFLDGWREKGLLDEEDEER
ncbi:hypothetical protein FRC07_011140, partial [Ceratobasidium sp. 392]